MIQTLKISVPSQVEKPPIPSSYGEGKVCSTLRYLIYTLCRAPHWLLGSQKLPKRCLRTVIQKCGLTAIPSVYNRKALGVCRVRAVLPLGKEGSPNNKELPWASATPQRSPSILFLLSSLCFCSFSLSNSRGARPGLYRVRGDTPFHGGALDRTGTTFREHGFRSDGSFTGNRLSALHDRRFNRQSGHPEPGQASIPNVLLLMLCISLPRRKTRETKKK